VTMLYERQVTKDGDFQCCAAVAAPTKRGHRRCVNVARYEIGGVDVCRKHHSSAPVPLSSRPRTILVRIRVGVSASGEWSAVGASDRVGRLYVDDFDAMIADDVINAHAGPIVAWYWATVTVPCPVAEHGDVAGEVELP